MCMLPKGLCRCGPAVSHGIPEVRNERLFVCLTIESL